MMLSCLVLRMGIFAEIPTTTLNNGVPIPSKNPIPIAVFILNSREIPKLNPVWELKTTA